MARLNDPPPPAAESIDALKRRFVRQNREIARANSTQSARIRNLECEVSRLLGENASLREQVIKLHYEAERSASNSVLANVETVKNKLEAKLFELGGLVKDLGRVRKAVDNQRAQKRKSIDTGSLKKSPDQKIWKNAVTLSEAVGVADGRLPPILEDKYYPRRTMSAEELLGLTTDPANLTDSPDLGPPPVAHFEEGDPIKFNPEQEQPSRPKSDVTAQEENPVMSANLETRKKRRESSHRRDLGTGKTNFDLTKTVYSIEPGTAQPLKTGAKRKLIVHDEDDSLEGRDTSEKGEFQYSRRDSDVRRLDIATSKPIVNRSSKSNETKAISSVSASRQHRREKSVDATTASVANTRKALGPKSVNTDSTNSPLKAGKYNGKEKIAEAKDELARVVRERNRLKTKPQSKGTSQPKDEGVAVVSETFDPVEKPVEPPPETPAPPPNDLFSPISTEPSAPRADSRDTPPPPDIGPDTGTGSFGRGSRRPRGTVNYAQPNLRDKMRRPTAELVDAVAAEERARQAKITLAESEQSNAVVVKQEDLTDGLPIWKTINPKDGKQREEPTSPLSNKTGLSTNDLPTSVITERRRRTVAPFQDDEESKATKSASGAASAIAALAAGSNKPRAVKHKVEKAGDDITRDALERQSIYDFTGSSPNNGESAEDPGGTNDVAKQSRSSRRHSSVPASSEQGRGSLSITRRGERRRESVLETRHDEDEDKGVGQPIARAKSVLELGADGGEVTLGRGERAASRRRSMML